VIPPSPESSLPAFQNGGKHTELYETSVQTIQTPGNHRKEKNATFTKWRKFEIDQISRCPPLRCKRFERWIGLRTDI